MGAVFLEGPPHSGVTSNRGTIIFNANKTPKRFLSRKKRRNVAIPEISGESRSFFLYLPLRSSAVCQAY